MMRFRSKSDNKKFGKRRIIKFVAVYTAFCLLFETFFPLSVFALTGGPSQPEVESFTPVGTSEMVDVFSGDFSYNIPLLDIEGYPINICYNSGISMDQEASWVGLGWNINPGVINRGMRGIPDDFAGEEIINKQNMKPNRTWGLTASAQVGTELFGEDILDFGLSLGGSYGFRYNNYTGFAVEQTVSAGISSGTFAKGPFTGGLGISVATSSDNGLSIAPNANFGVRILKTHLGIDAATSFNSRTGLKNLTLYPSISFAQKREKVVDDISPSGNKTQKIINGYKNHRISPVVSSSFNFGTSTYSPKVSMPLHHLSVTANFKVGAEFLGTHPNMALTGYYSEQRIKNKSVSNPGYGYIFSDLGVLNNNAILDFNREKDGPFTPNSISLPLTNFTADIFSVSGQGVSGSYRAFRSDLGHVYDAESYTTSNSLSLGLELGTGNLTHGGANVATTNVTTKSGRWGNENFAAQVFSFKAQSNSPLYEKVYFKDANDKSVDSDVDFYNTVAKNSPVKIDLLQNEAFSTFASSVLSGKPVYATNNYRKAREKRNKTISILSRQELEKGLGVQSVHPSALPASSLNNFAKQHHIAEISALNDDGTRYIYGIAAYNLVQHETTFAIDENNDANSYTGLATYNAAQNSIDNSSGRDGYYNSIITPAYAHSYLLTAVLSPDYVDADRVQGPSDGDLGSYTKFSYIKNKSIYKWRVPFEKNMASYFEGIKCVDYDDKVNYIYGEKELWYLDTIQTKNYIAIFATEPRNDGFGVNDLNGGLYADINSGMRMLKRISLYSKKDYSLNGANAVPIKEVHFEYDYSLCQGLPNYYDAANPLQELGKLTLKKIYFTYGNSKKARLSPYVFNYSNVNPDYNLKNYDRWGSYKKPHLTSGFGDLDSLPVFEFPYAEQNVTKANYNAKAWHLEKIKLPSGGEINVNYEADDYAYVQNKKAMQMFKIVHIGNTLNTGNGIKSIDLKQNDNKLWFELSKDATGQYITDIKKYFEGIDYLYYKFLMKLIPGVNISGTKNYEYVSGYAKIAKDAYGQPEIGISNNYGFVRLKSVSIKDKNNSGTYVCPIVKTAIQYGRLNMSDIVFGNDNSINENISLKEILKKIINSYIFNNVKEAILGPNKALYNKEVGTFAISNKSWIRLNNVTGHKFGGGARVSKITISDEWANMTDQQESSYTYGQEYFYVNENGTSSGVACYEPLIGGEENPFKTPFFYKEENLYAPDNEHYVETPFGESFFPSASVGYSRVLVRNLQRSGVKRNATGYVVHEFYTAKNFPTITNRTGVQYVPNVTNSSFSISSLLKLHHKDYMTATQGFVIELNDMHGKPKGQKVFQEDNNIAISSIEYKYKTHPYLTDDCYTLDNDAIVIDSKGNVSDATIGVFFDFISDMREQKTQIATVSINSNFDAFTFFLPLAIFNAIPCKQKETTQFRSAVVTKVIQRFGLLDEVIAKDLGSKVSTKNLAYDAETGEVILTQTITNYDDNVYSLSFPAHWYYDGMGAAYKNIGFTTNLSFTNGYAYINNAQKYFIEGDELALPFISSAPIKAWVVSVEPNSIYAVYKDGMPVDGHNGFTKILRSGRRNQQSIQMANITTLSNPIAGVKTNLYNKVIQAEATEFSNKWRTFCDCFVSPGEGKRSDTTDLHPMYSTNPYINGTKGLWKPVKSYLHLSERTQNNYNNNTNIRKDGQFASFVPFYKFEAGKWNIYGKNWTYTSEVTEFSPYGFELENKDALGRYSSAIYGYGQSLATAVAANAKYREIGFDNFEDYNFGRCADLHFTFKRNKNIVVDDAVSHTGKKSIKVNNNSSVALSKQLVACNLAECNITASLNYDAQANEYSLDVADGMQPYSFDWDIVGNADVLFGNNGNTVIIPNPSEYTIIEVTVDDYKKCSLIKRIICNGTNCFAE